LRVLSILVRTGTEKFTDAEQRNADLFRRHLRGIQHDTLVVDNALPAEFEDRRERRSLIGGDNSFSEFSGWDRGIRSLGDDLWRYDVVHLVTSAFHSLYTAYLERFTTDMLRVVARRAVCLGHIDCYNEPVRYGPFHFQHWVRTSFVFLAPLELKVLDSLVTVRDSAGLFSHDLERPFREGAPMSAGYRGYVLDWLRGNDIGQGVTWHSGFELDESTLTMFQRKTTAILNEQLLGVRLRAGGCRVIDVTWLATMLARLPAARIRWDTPWHEQLADRAWDALRLPGAGQVDRFAGREARA
jgi:hypothetical protein